MRVRAVIESELKIAASPPPHMLTPGMAALQRRHGDMTRDDSVWVPPVLTVAAAEAAVGLAILVAFFRNRGDIAVEDANLMKN